MEHSEQFILLWTRKICDQLLLKEFFKIAFTFFLTIIAWIFFRSESVSQALDIVRKIFSMSLFEDSVKVPNVLFLGIFVFFIIEWIGRRDSFPLERSLNNCPRYLRLSFYYLIIIILFVFGGSQQEFIYFQFQFHAPFS